MKARTWTWLPIVASLSLTACGKTIDWKQEVKLHDGRMIVVERQSKLGPTRFPENVALEDAQTLKFAHPATGERIEWVIPKGLQPVALDFDQGIPYYVLKAYTVADYNNWGCPNPPYLIFRYHTDKWQQVSFAELPAHFARRNVVPMSKYIKGIENNRIVTPAEVDAVNSEFRPDDRTIGREKVNPIARGCFESVLHKQGRQSEIDTRR